MENLKVLYNGNPAYDIEYHESFQKLGEELKALGYSDRKICIVSETKVADFYMDDLKAAVGLCTDKVYSYVFLEGEESKNLDTVRALYTYLVENRFDRKDVLVALGGGVVGDLTGYTAATYLRGIDFVQVPTSLLSQVDSSIGGKTGVDFDSYKNMVGAFYMPKLVYINLNALKSLDKRQLYSGMGEIVKHGLIRDKEYYYWLKDNLDNIKSLNPDTIYQMVRQSNIIKKNVVENDPKEQGERALLNFGHTLGHSIEKYMCFEFLHGECVFIGSILAAIISYNRGYISLEEKNDIIEFIMSFDVPVVKKETDIDKLLQYTKNDKKVEGNKIKFILLNKIGDAFIDTEVTEDDMRLALNELLEKIYE